MPEQAAVHQAPQPAAPPRRCLLVIEDDPAVAGLLATVLESEECDVLHSSDGPVALQMAAAARLELIVLDLGLPDVDGRSLLRALKDSPATASIPVIIISAFAHLLA